MPPKDRMNDTPSVAEQFGGDAARRLEAMYLTPDIVAQRAAVLDRLRLQLGERVLDIGSGPGLLAASMAEQVGARGEIRGVDVSDTMVGLATARCSAFGWAGFQVADATSLPFADGSFDVVACTQVLEYVPAVEAAIAEIRRVLRPGGRALIMDTDWQSCLWASSDDARMRRMLEAWDTHCAQPRLPRLLCGLLGRGGLEVRRVSTLPLINLAWSADTYSHGIAHAIAAFVGKSGLVPALMAEQWLEDFRVLAGTRNRYFFSLDRFMFET